MTSYIQKSIYLLIAIIITFIFTNKLFLENYYGCFGFLGKEKFGDLHAFLCQLEEFKHGGNPYFYINPNYNAPLYNYPPFFKIFSIFPGFTLKNINIIGFILIFLSLCLSLINLRPKSYKHYFFWIIMILSPSFGLAFERANNDLIIFIIISIAIIFYKNKIISNLAICLSGFLKLYPIAGLGNLLLIEKSKKNIFFAIGLGLLFILYLFIVKDEIILVINNTPSSIYDFGYGFTVIPKIILEKFLNNSVFVYLSYFVFCLIWFILIFRFLNKNLLVKYNTKTLSFYSFTVGSLIVTFTYLIGISWDYRKIFIFFTIPFLIENYKNKIIKSILLLAILVCWEQFFVKIVFPYGKRYVYTFFSNMLFLTFVFSILSIIAQNTVTIKRDIFNFSSSE